MARRNLSNAAKSLGPRLKTGPAVTSSGKPKSKSKSSKLESCVRAVKKTGKSKSSAFAICQAQANKSKSKNSRKK